NQNESSHAVGLATYYGGFFPVLNAGITYTANRDVRELNKAYTANQIETQFGFSIPLNFSQGKTYKFLNFGSNYVYNETRPTAAYKDMIHSKSAGYLYHFVNWSQQLPTALQHIYPKFAYAISLSDRHLLNGDGAQFLGGTALYLPSIKNHSLVLTANLQATDTLLLPAGQTAILSNRFANSRGYNDYYFSRMWRLGGNYHMPLFYPDWGFGNILYFLRVRSNVFYDYTRVYSRNKMASREQRSVGGEIYFDTRWWNMLPVSFGFRVSHLLDDDFSGQRPKGSNIFEFIIPMNLIP
ncbi:MAG TPA: hypothetical protein VFL47_00335, partial [Flavisolibacter sp.]|nr:hypothetical protein [Flavisolibacter sp.]